MSGPPDFGWITPDDRRWLEWNAWSDRILVMTSEGPAVVYVPEDGLPNYEPDGDIAEPEEWTAWSVIPRIKKTNTQ